MTRAPIADRFWARVKKAGPDECWLWTGSHNVHGYGEIRSGGAGEPKYLAHRVAWELHCGPIAEGVCVCHHCDIPLCVNPAHLFLGTLTDNNLDRDAKGRGGHGALSGEDNPGSKLTVQDVLEIRRMYAAGGVSQRIVGLRFSISQTHVGAIVRRELWSHLVSETTNA